MNVFNNVIGGMKNYSKQAYVIIGIGAVYSIWLWRSSDMGLVLLVSNALSVISMIFFLVAIYGVLHNVHAMAAFSYSFKWVSRTIHNATRRDELTGEKMMDYAEYIRTYKKWKMVAPMFEYFLLFLILSLLIWFIFT